MTPDTVLQAIREFGLPMVFLVIVAWVLRAVALTLLSTLKEANADMKAQRDAANVRLDAALEVGRSQVKATEDLSTLLRESLSRRRST